MINRYNYWYFEKAISDENCKKIIDFAKKKNSKKIATIGNLENLKSKKSKKFKELKKTRHSDVVWLDEKFIYDLIVPYVQTANRNSGWNYDFNRWESAQFTIYGKNQYYHWHADTTPEPSVEENNNKGTLRKLSMSLQLSDEKEYSGGNLQFDLRDIKNKRGVITDKRLRQKGTLVVFPSYVWHRVTPVTKGTRYSLVMWFRGLPWK